MNSIKEIKKFNFTPPAVALFLFFRAILLTDRNYLGSENLYDFSFSFANENIVLIVLYLLFSVLAAVVIAKLGRKFGDAVSWISVLFVAEPLFFAKQVNCIILFITVLGLIFILNGLREKSVITNEITLVVFLLVSCVLAENAIFTFVAPALMVYFIGGIENTLKSTKKIIMLILSVISVGAGIFIHDFLIEKYSGFKNFIDTYTFADNIYFKHIPYENALLFVFLIPTIVFGGLFFAEMFKENNEKSSTVPYVILGVTVCAYILSTVGFIMGGSDNFYTANFFIPVTIISMLNSDNSDAEKALEKVNSIVGKYSLVFVATVVFLCFLAVRIFYENVDNIAGFVLTI